MEALSPTQPYDPATSASTISAESSAPSDRAEANPVDRQPIDGQRHQHGTGHRVVRPRRLAVLMLILLDERAQDVIDVLLRPRTAEAWV
ncbi:hypothetical protein AB0952_17750 [Streptomyces caniferus]|uniref:hypothetical protein n=1 Tax=Streptomyces caniferus TaxID=285557 RepID=UPI0034534C82